MGMRRMGSTIRARQKLKSMKRNAPRKVKERARRDARMLTALQAASLPYTPWVMSWLSTQLDKKSTAITQDDVQGLLAAHSAVA